MIQYASYDSPYGKLHIGCEEGYIVSIRCGDRDKNHTAAKEQWSSELTKRAFRQLSEYFARQRKVFDLPIRLKGTEFQISVWKELQKIPYGETRSYKEIAAAIGKPKACRAVGMANNRNPLWIVVPCHRVIGANRELTGYAGGLEMKRSLLELEQSLN